MRLVVVIVVLLAHHAAAHACKHGGKVLFRETTRPLDGEQGTETRLTIYATGAWERIDANGEAGGCLAKKHLRALKRALGKARFALDTVNTSTCKARSTTEVIYTSRRKRVTTATPCGPPVDEWTANLAVCAEHAGSGASVGEITMLCRGLDPLM